MERVSGTNLHFDRHENVRLGDIGSIREVEKARTTTAI
jgi:hypothetical protein